MFKRRDWLHIKGADGADGGDTDSSDDDSMDERRRDRLEGGGSSSEEGEDEQEEEGSDDDDGMPYGPPGERSEEEEDGEPGASVHDVIRVWTSDDPEVNQFKGIPLRCVPCKALLLNRVSYLQHVGSKTHKAKVKHVAGGEEEAIQLASDTRGPDQEEEETHGERLERIRNLSSAPSKEEKPQAAKGKGRSKSRLPPKDEEEDPEDGSSEDGEKETKTKKSQPKGASKGGGETREKVIEKRKRPGKRQREAMKLEGKNPSTGKKFKAPKKNPKPSAQAKEK